MTQCASILRVVPHSFFFSYKFASEGCRRRIVCYIKCSCRQVALQIIPTSIPQCTSETLYSALVERITNVDYSTAAYICLYFRVVWTVTCKLRSWTDNLEYYTFQRGRRQRWLCT